MRFLLDENLSPKVCPLLDAAGHDAVHVRDCALAGAPDAAVLAYAARDSRIVVTADRADFGRELAGSGDATPSVILLRQLARVVRAADVTALLIANLTPDIIDALDWSDGRADTCGGSRALPADPMTASTSALPSAYPPRQRRRQVEREWHAERAKPKRDAESQQSHGEPSA